MTKPQAANSIKLLLTGDERTDLLAKLADNTNSLVASAVEKIKKAKQRPVIGGLAFSLDEAEYQALLSALNEKNDQALITKLQAVRQVGDGNA